MDTIPVWVMPHDDPEVGWIVNDVFDMLSNYDDLRDEGIAQGSFVDYLSTWTQLEMPLIVWNSAGAAAWVEENT